MLVSGISGTLRCSEPQTVDPDGLRLCKDSCEQELNEFVTRGGDFIRYVSLNLHIYFRPISRAGSFAWTSI